MCCALHERDRAPPKSRAARGWRSRCSASPSRACHLLPCVSWRAPASRRCRRAARTRMHPGVHQPPPTLQPRSALVGLLGAVADDVRQAGLDELPRDSVASVAHVLTRLASLLLMSVRPSRFSTASRLMSESGRSAFIPGRGTGWSRAARRPRAAWRAPARTAAPRAGGGPSCAPQGSSRARRRGRSHPRWHRCLAAAAGREDGELQGPRAEAVLLAQLRHEIRQVAPGEGRVGNNGRDLGPRRQNRHRMVVPPRRLARRTILALCRTPARFRSGRARGRRSRPWYADRPQGADNVVRGYVRQRQAPRWRGVALQRAAPLPLVLWIAPLRLVACDVGFGGGVEGDSPRLRQRVGGLLCRRSSIGSMPPSSSARLAATFSRARDSETAGQAPRPMLRALPCVV